MVAPAVWRFARSQAEPLVGGSPDRTRRAIWSVLALMGVLLLGYLAYSEFRTSAAFSPWIDGWVVVIFEGVASGLCVAAARRRRTHRRVALVMGAACFSWTIGDLLLTVETLGGGAPPPPSAADIFYLGFFPLALVAMLLYTREEIRAGHIPNWLDGAIAALGVAALCSAFAAHALGHLVANGSLGDVTQLAYPVGDLLVLGIVAGTTVVVSGRSRATLALISVGMAIVAAGDTFNFVGAGRGGVGDVVNAVAWPTALLAVAMSMWVGDDDSDRFALHRVSGLVLPAVVTCSSLGILVAGSWHHFGSLSVGLATLTLVLVGVRLAFRPALRIAREQLRASDERYRLLFEQNPQPMVVYDRATLEIVAVSDAMIAAYGYSRDELLSMSIPMLLPPEDVEHLLAFLSANPDGARPELAGAPAGYPGHHRLKDGTVIEIEVTSSNLDLNGRACRIAHFDDVTLRNKAAAEIAIARDQAVEASNTKSAFLANVSHEIRTPMNGVIGMNELLLGTELTSEQREYAEQVTRSGEQMLAIINDVLDLSKIETGHFELDITDFDLHETIKETCSVAGGQARVKGLRLELEIADEVPLRRRGDGRRLRQILLNLVSNAVKFTSDGSVSIRVSAAPRANAALVRMEVADTGIGIDAASVHRMFEPFTQADASTTRNYGGTGLGLAIARELVEMMGGTIGADSTVGHGSTFWFEVELAAPAATELPSSHQAGANGGLHAWATPPLVLVAEDSQINQIVAARSLERCGCRTHIVGDGLEALKALETQRYDAVLMDCQMPSMDGYETTAELRRREHGARTPVIAMTAHAMDGDRQRCLDAGMDDYITKPMRYQELSDKLHQWITGDVDDASDGPDAEAAAWADEPQAERQTA